MARKEPALPPIVLGGRYRDSITGYEGVATARYEYLTGCVRYCLEGPDKDGAPAEYVFDEQRLTTVDAQPTADRGRAGGSFPSPPRTGLK